MVTMIRIRHLLSRANQRKLEANPPRLSIRGCKDDGSMLTRSEAWGGLKRAREAAGLRKFGCLIHVGTEGTFASHIVMAGKPLKAVQELPVRHVAVSSP